jgi:DNA-binding response OmpR family regulator
MVKHILVIDDEDQIRKIFRQTFKKEDYRVETVESGNKGIERIKRQTYDLIFLDLSMPGMTGIETLRALRKIDSKVPIYVITGFYEAYFDELKKLGKENIEFEVLNKPFTSKQILMVTKSILAQNGKGVHDE